ncbi:hypothetical protein JOD45_001821 [Scopulibacillus daqui]|uniref:Aminotransferase class IV n=1 Tax=Scopulibacillus daqui TaxID=1469162 RepID=A0ABS2PZY9_9BACL|nr:hypothetical protein [Scopulibacillus daqui]
MSSKIFINGNFVNKDEATINVFDHGLLYGDGIYEGMRCYSDVVFKLDEHLYTGTLRQCKNYVCAPLWRIRVYQFTRGLFDGIFDCNITNTRRILITI